MKQIFTSIFLASTFIQTAVSVSFEWDCTNSLGTCENYCYAAQCSPGFGGGKKFTYDNDSKAADARRVKSGCSKNPCNASTGVSPFNKFGTSCDEFPFASTREGGTGASLRCVHPTDNSSEGGQLSQFYKKLNNGDKFDIFIKNFVGAPSCGNKPSCKNTDSSQFKMNSAGAMVKNPKRSATGYFEASEPLPSASRSLRKFRAEDGTEYLLLNNNPDEEFEGTQLDTQNGHITIAEEL